MFKPLDNPIWSALSTRDRHFNIGNDVLKYFPDDVCPFVGLQNWDATDMALLEQELPSQRTFSVLLSKDISLPSTIERLLAIPLYQMICPGLQPFSLPGINVIPLGKEHVPAMVALTALTKPGPFYQRTIEFGNYIGIFEGDRLAAMAGERMHLEGFTEVSAICTHPDFLGKGYASVLLSQAASRIINEGATPYLHVRSDNHRAIKMYERLGFEIRADIGFVMFKRSEKG